MENKRIYLFDNLKFLLILTVVVGHFASDCIDTIGFKSLFLFIYSFHMPAFIFISGLFFKDEDIPKKVFSYFNIYLIYKFTLQIVKLSININTNFSIFTTDGIPWFMFALAAFNILTHYLKKLNPKMVLFISVLFACFAGYDKNIGDYLMLSRIIIYFPFFFAGTIFNKNKIIEYKNNNKKMIILAIILILGWAFLCLFCKDTFYPLRPLFTGRNAFPESFMVYGPLIRLMCYGITSVIIYSLIIITPNIKIIPITKYGSRTLQVYFWHLIFLYFLTNLTNIKDLCNTIPGEMIYLFIGVILTFILSLKIFGFPLNQILKYSKR